MGHRGAEIKNLASQIEMLKLNLQDSRLVVNDLEERLQCHKERIKGLEMQVKVFFEDMHKVGGTKWL